MQEPISEEVARQRWIVIQMTRVTGVVLVVLGILLIRRVISLAGEVDEMLGYGLLAVGLVDALIAPILLARRWKTPLP